MLFFGDDHGGEAVVGRRDAYWASGGSAVTNSLLLSAVWVVGAVFADRNAPALGGILNQQGVGNSTVGAFFSFINFMSCINVVNSLTAIRVLAGTKNSRPVGFLL